MTETTDASALLLSRIRDVEDHPEPGVMFKDITPLLADPKAFAVLSDALVGEAALAEADLAGTALGATA